ncbi:diguanylate cyclase [Methylococcus sp. EFPC2]|uniref:diguanylate cyclase n=1 Tax=Methylococcus sp. EFPC2 TaxID=2812648 RepID=UPI0019678B20|nr:diguanylate cyclase [Methylococcus sp. EFPC2]QSA97569.1 diguanylate cyclase [Methylococcus sp. EFPC2]
MNAQYPIKFTALLTAAVWTLLLLASLGWNIARYDHEVTEQVRLQAKSFIDKDLSFRSWAAAHGGVYVQPSAKSPPNPYLKNPGRDVVTTDGMALTLINPAYMMRQVLDDYSRRFGISGRITSLNPINPANVPSPWEADAMRRFQEGGEEFGERVEYRGKHEFRYIRALHIEQSCLSCHADQGYREGDIRGAISTSIDMAPYEASVWSFTQVMLASHGGIWLIGLLAIGGSARWQQRQASKAARAEAQALESERLYHDLKVQQAVDDADRENAARFNAVMVATLDSFVIVGRDGQIVEVNQVLCDLLGYTRKELLAMNVAEIEAKESPLGARQQIARIVERGRDKFEVLVLCKDGRKITVEVNACYQPIEGGRIYGFMRDITERKRLEQARELANEDLKVAMRILEAHQAELAQLNRMSATIQICRTRPEAWQALNLALPSLLEGMSGVLAIKKAGATHLEVVAQWGGVEPESVFAVHDCWAIRTGGPHWALTPNNAMLCKHFTRAPEGPYLCLPLFIQGELAGVLTILKRAGQLFSDQEKRLIATVAESLSLELSNLDMRLALHEQATHDGLTRLFNRRYLNETLPREIARAERGGTPLCAVMMDIDRFKTFNDAHGHEVGDIVLQQLADLLREKLRRGDIACRYGGEEFVVIMPDSSLDDTFRRIDDIRQQMQTTELRRDGQTWGWVSFSAGVAQLSEDLSDGGKLLKAADQALYQAKKNGRNQVVVYRAGGWRNGEQA